MLAKFRVNVIHGRSLAQKSTRSQSVPLLQNCTMHSSSLSNALVPLHASLRLFDRTWPFSDKEILFTIQFNRQGINFVRRRFSGWDLGIYREAFEASLEKA